MKDFISRVTSRKFLLAVAAFIVCAANNEWTQAVAVVIGYITGNAVVGAVDKYNQ